MRFIFLLLGFVAATTVNSQFYYNDIVSTRQTNDLYKQLRANKVKKITGTSYEPDNAVSEGFLMEQEISMDGKRITVTTAVMGSKPSQTIHTYEMSRLRHSRSFNNGIENKTEYVYSPQGNIQKVSFITTDTAMKYSSTETHEWSYGANGEILSMLRIKNQTDSVQVDFLWEDGLIAEEHWKRRGKDFEVYYYYYDDAKRLTDIVRYNPRLKKLLPDFQYEYDANSRLVQMTQVSLASANYLIWKYTYNEKGLRASEAGFDKEKKLVGRVEYSYDHY